MTFNTAEARDAKGRWVKALGVVKKVLADEKKAGNIKQPDVTQAVKATEHAKERDAAPTAAMLEGNTKQVAAKVLDHVAKVQRAGAVKDKAAKPAAAAQRRKLARAAENAAAKVKGVTAPRSARRKAKEQKAAVAAPKAKKPLGKTLEELAQLGSPKPPAPKGMPNLTPGERMALRKAVRAHRNANPADVQARLLRDRLKFGKYEPHELKPAHLDLLHQIVAKHGTPEAKKIMERYTPSRMKGAKGKKADNAAVKANHIIDALKGLAEANQGQVKPDVMDLSQAEYSLAKVDARMKQLATSDITMGRKLGGGNINTVYVGKAGANMNVIIKPAADLYKGGKQQIRRGITPGMDMEREHASFIIANEMGVLTPPLVVRNVPSKGKSSVQEMVPEAVTAHEWARERHIMTPGRLMERLPDKEGMRTIGLLDAVIGNSDRHHGNYMVNKRGQVIAIDHGLVLPEKAVDYRGNNQLQALISNQPLSPKEKETLKKLLNEDFIKRLTKTGIPVGSINMMKTRVREMLSHGKVLPTGKDLFP